MDKKQLHDDLLELCHAIENIPASEDQTAASVKANALLGKVLDAIKADEPMPRVMTVGQRIVRTEFNPSKTGLVDQLKQQHARLIDLVYGIAAERSEHVSPEDHPLMMNNIVRSMEALENSAMQSVKAATAGMK